MTWLALVLVLVAAPAWAELQPKEAAELGKARVARRSITTGLRDYVVPYLGDPIVASVMTQGLAAARETAIATGLLLNVITEQHSTPPFATLAAMPREDRVALAWWRLDRVAAFLTGAQKSAAAARSATADPMKQDAMRRVSDIWLAGALTRLTALDRSLAYADPNPAAFPQIVGPHGDFEGAEWALYRAVNYAHNAMDIEPVAATRLLAATDVVVDAMLLLAGVTWTPHQATEGNFFRTLEVLEMLTSDDVNFAVPERWQQAMAVVTTTAAKNVTADAWKHTDLAAWRLMIFLKCELLRNPAGCGGR